MKIALFTYPKVKLLSFLGITHPFFDVHIVTVFETWIAMAILFLLAWWARRYAKGKENPFTHLIEQTIRFLVSDLCVEAFGYFRYDYFAFIATIFFFTLSCNMVGMLPFIEEPTNDLHTTVALGALSFLFVQYHKVRVHGLRGYLNEYIQPFFLMAPLNLIGEFAKVVSMSFRLFGNILGGSIVLYLLVEMVSKFKGSFMIFTAVTLVVYVACDRYLDLKLYPKLNMLLLNCLGLILVVPLTQMFFGIFEGVVQAFVITMLTVTYLSVGAYEEGIAPGKDAPC